MDYLRRLPRRALMMIGVVTALFLAVALLPVWIVVACLADLRAGWSKHRYLRVFAMVVALLINEMFGIVGLFVVWVLSGFGLAMHSGLSYRMHGWIHGRWTHNILRSTELFLGTQVIIDNPDAVEPSPVIIMQRHISLLDAVIPSVLIAYRRRNTPRHVLMRELRFDPSIETLVHRVPNHFVDRVSGGAREIAAITDVGRSLGPGGSGVIFPEGGFRTPRRFEKVVASIERRNPALAERARRYRHVLPPRIAGSQALLAGAPGVDVVVVAHAGFDGMGSVAEIVRGVPINRPVHVRLRRFDRASIPEDTDGFTQWMFDRYDEIDDFVERYMAGHAHDAPSSPDSDVADVRNTVEVS